MGGFANAEAFYRGVVHEEPRNARRFQRVAKYASPDEETRYGVTKLDAALGFIEAKLGEPLAHPPLPIAFEKLRIPMIGDKSANTKSLAEASIQEVTQATSKLTATWHKKPKTSAESALVTSIGKVSSLDGVRVREKNGLVSFANVPLSAIHHFVGALTKTKWAETAAPKKVPAAKKKAKP